jgi:hypothetical protein
LRNRSGVCDAQEMSIGLAPARVDAMRLRRSRHGAHYFDRASGLNVLLDEIAFPSDRWHRAPRYVSIALTNACELRCPFCYAPKVPARLSAERVLAWAIELDEAGGLGIGFGGGEPTAHPQFVWLCEQVSLQTGLMRIWLSACAGTSTSCAFRWMGWARHTSGCGGAPFPNCAGEWTSSPRSHRSASTRS